MQIWVQTVVTYDPSEARQEFLVKKNSTVVPAEETTKLQSLVI